LICISKPLSARISPVPSSDTIVPFDGPLIVPDGQQIPVDNRREGPLEFGIFAYFALESASIFK
jgi:hypothetical protein